MNRFDNVTVVLADRRTECMSFETFLKKMPSHRFFYDIFCCNSKASTLEIPRSGSFFHYLKKYGNRESFFPQNHQKMFVSYLVYLQQNFENTSSLVLHIPYDTYHIITKTWIKHSSADGPFFLQLLRELGVKICHFAVRYSDSALRVSQVFKGYDKYSEISCQSTRYPLESSDAKKVPNRTEEFEDFILLLARKRSGTHAVKSWLSSHSDVYCTREIFNPKLAEKPRFKHESWQLFVRSNYDDVVVALLPENVSQTFQSYLRYLRSIIPKKYIILDIKQASLGAISTPPKLPIDGIPFLLSFFVERKMKILRLRRSNILRHIVSSQKAKITKRWIQRTTGAESFDLAVELNPEETVALMRNFIKEDEVIAGWLKGYGRICGYEYARLFPNMGGVIDEVLLKNICCFLGLRPERLKNSESMSRLASLPLKNSIKNFLELKEVLEKANLHHYLADEPAYETVRLKLDSADS